MPSDANNSDDAYLLSELIGGKARVGGKAIGKLADVIVTEQGKLPEVTHLLIDRPFGYKSLMVPWDKVERLGANGRAELSIAALEPYEGEPADGQICLRDHLLDKKVLDSDDDEVEVVYDIKLAARHGRLYVTDVDCSRAGFLRRIGLRKLANFIRSVAAKIDDDTIPWTYVQQLPQNMGGFNGNVKLNVLKEKLPDIHPVDLADILEELEHDQRMAIFNQLDTEHASDTLEEVEPRVQRDLVSSLTIERVTELVNEMTPGQAADVLAELPASESDAILEKIEAPEALKVRSLIENHEDQVLFFATTHYITFPPQTTRARSDVQVPRGGQGRRRRDVYLRHRSQRRSARRRRHQGAVAGRADRHARARHDRQCRQPRRERHGRRGVQAVRPLQLPRHPDRRRRERHERRDPLSRHHAIEPPLRLIATRARP